MRNARAIAASLLVLCLPAAVRAQTPGAAAPSAGQLRVFLDCRVSCDLDFVRTELPFLDHVRDVAQADVHVLVNGQQTGAGGASYEMRFIGRESFRGLDDEVTFATAPDATPDVTRRAITAHLALGLGRYLARTDAAGRVKLTAAGGPGGPPPAPRKDPWNSWVFSLSANGFLNGEHLQRYANGYGSLSANRVTDRWKTLLSMYGSYSENRFELSDGSVVLSASRSYSAAGLQMRALGAHWSAGAIAGARTSTYSNYDLGVSLAPALEYDIFPYSQSSKRQLSIRYAAGASSVRYTRTTIYDRDSEFLPSHDLSVRLITKQPWGSTSLSLSSSQYLSHPDQYAVGGYGEFSVRIVKGLSFQANGDLEMLRNQRSLPRGGASTEEILLQRRELATSYRYYGSVGLSYSFGSMLNNIVNTRFPSASFMFASP